MSEMVKRVARAMCKASDLDPDSEWGGVPRWHDLRGLATAAICAMREPTDEMLVAAEDAAPALASFADREQSPSYLAWRAMIDEALR